MLPVIALVGRPNVGKSTLFNFLTRTRNALVADMPGVTRDRLYGAGRVGERPYLVVDTGGLSGNAEGVDALMEQQAMQAIDEADAVLFLVDARDGMTSADQAIANMLRRCNKPIYLALNKSEGLNIDVVSAEFFALGIGEPLPVASAHGSGVADLIEMVFDALPPEEEGDSAEQKGIRIAVVGRPNVGKSTLVNRILGEERVLAYDMPGTTRDSIFIPFERDDERYVLIDTAGVRRKAKVKETIEKFSAIKALQAINEANVVILVLDAHEEISDQDAWLAGHAVDSGRAMVVAVNKWDGLASDERDWIKRELERKLMFLDFADTHFISALHGSGVGNLFDSIQDAYESATRKLNTPDLTRILEDAVSAHQPPLVKGRRIKLRYAHQGGQNPPLIVVHGNQTAAVPDSYQRYLMNKFRKILKLKGTPIRVDFKSGENPFKDKKKPPREKFGKKNKRIEKYRKK
ncbi:ribosome biogenesis GTPase Der [Solemya pervernicosa gill symbiont]|uniref:GTPase Der n=2 Tax=Gammaproteobacteria incertae sedis TaxID=118884 RepID=A0A1T2LAV6_9GAMM|nr:ribosome biogenesis GTPase Der [Candidatus Reidiella endopervernicosa]OOZ42200.1 ribosome biogenesis GTPase Der [Solemya pervernicosa gill symbiont]QKQ27232.1 ribosome biogenesis GTPase Der [Candidatus Reidiella endopervernicosa]